MNRGVWGCVSREDGCFGYSSSLGFQRDNVGAGERKVKENQSGEKVMGLLFLSTYE